MNRYSYEITNNDDSFFPFEYGTLLHNYLSFHFIQNIFEIVLENIEIYLTDENIIGLHTKTYPNSCITQSIKCGLDNTDLYCSFYLKKLNLKIEYVQYISIKIKYQRKIFWHSFGAFKKNDKSFFTSGKCLNYKDVYYDIFVVYSNTLTAYFKEEDIVIHNYDDIYALYESKNINKEKLLSLNLLDNFNPNNYNNIPSIFFNQRDYNNFFDDGLAIKDYTPNLSKMMY